MMCLQSEFEQVTNANVSEAAGAGSDAAAISVGTSAIAKPIEAIAPRFMNCSLLIVGSP
jgi:hypothetical protein